MTYIDRNGHGEFTELEAWLKEYHLFHKLENIPFFGQYKSRKVYQAWKKTILHSKITRAKKELMNSLFICDPVLSKTLIDVRKELLDFTEKNSILSVESEKTYFLPDFMKENYTSLHKTFETDFKELQRQIRLSTETATLESLKSKGFDLKWDFEKSQIIEDAEYPKLTFTEQGARRNECRKLQHFVKLVDYFQIEAVHGLVHTATWSFLRTIFNHCDDMQIHEIFNKSKDEESNSESDSLLQSRYPQILTSEIIQGGPHYLPHLISCISNPHHKVDRPGEYIFAKVEQAGSDTVFTPLFHVTVLLESDGVTNEIICTPASNELMQDLRGLFKKILDSTDNFSLLTNSISFLQPANLPGGSSYVVRGLEEPEYTGTIQISAIITDSRFFMESLGRIWASIHAMFQNAWTWTQGLNDIKHMWEENETFDVLEKIGQDVGPLGLVLATANSKNVEGGIISLLTNHFATEAAKIDPAILELGIANIPFSLLPHAATVREDVDGGCISPLSDFFHSHLEKFAQQKTAMQAIPNTFEINNILLDLKKLKAKLLPSPERCFSDIVKILPDIARDKNELLLGEIQSWLRIVRNPPPLVEFFVEYLVWLEEGIPLILTIYE